MSRSVPQMGADVHPNTVDLSRDSRSTDVDLLSWIRKALSDQGWKLDALEREMRKDKAYISRVLNGDKPLSAEFIRALPDDVEAIVVTLWAESFGRIVVAPCSSAQAAIESLTRGLFGLLAPQLPAKSAGQLKAELRNGEERRRA